MDGPAYSAINGFDGKNFTLSVTEENLIFGYSACMKDCSGRFKSPNIPAGSFTHSVQNSRHRADEYFSVRNNRLNAGHKALIGK